MSEQGPVATGIGQVGASQDQPGTGRTSGTGAQPNAHVLRARRRKERGRVGWEGPPVGPDV